MEFREKLILYEPASAGRREEEGIEGALKGRGGGARARRGGVPGGNLAYGGSRWGVARGAYVRGERYSRFYKKKKKNGAELEAWLRHFLFRLFLKKKEKTIYIYIY